jgi:hypothetical protein
MSARFGIKPARLKTIPPALSATFSIPLLKRGRMPLDQQTGCLRYRFMESPHAQKARIGTMNQVLGAPISKSARTLTIF